MTGVTALTPFPLPVVVLGPRGAVPAEEAAGIPRQACAPGRDHGDGGAAGLPLVFPADVPDAEVPPR